MNHWPIRMGLWVTKVHSRNLDRIRRRHAIQKVLLRVHTPAVRRQGRRRMLGVVHRVQGRILVALRGRPFQTPLRVRRKQIGRRSKMLELCLDEVLSRVVVSGVHKSRMGRVGEVL